MVSPVCSAGPCLIDTLRLRGGVEGYVPFGPWCSATDFTEAPRGGSSDDLYTIQLRARRSRHGVGVERGTLNGRPCDEGRI